MGAQVAAEDTILVPIKLSIPRITTIIHPLQMDTSALSAVSNDGRYLQLAPGMLIHCDMKTIGICTRHGHYHYWMCFVDDNSGRAFPYFLRFKYSALTDGLRPFYNYLCTQRTTRCALRLDNAGEYCVRWRSFAIYTASIASG